MDSLKVLPRNSNQALGLGQFACDFLRSDLGDAPSEAVLRRTELFHLDAALCGVSALALNANAPVLLRAEALRYADDRGATVFGCSTRVKAEKAVLANASAVREWDSNGTNFGYNPLAGHVAGEFGHNDYYAVAVAACQELGLTGGDALRAMVLIDEIRGRLAEVFSLKTFKIDHVLHGAIASAAAFAALHGASPEQIESAIGMVVAHFVPWRAIRAGRQLSDSKGASAAFSAEVAVMCARRALAGFQGPKDIFRNPESVFRYSIPTQADSPFDLNLCRTGDGFAVMGMHFKLGLYEHQSAGALQGLFDLLLAGRERVCEEDIAAITIRAYEPAFGIIGDPAKRDPRTRQSADHSMLYIVATTLRKAIEMGDNLPIDGKTDALWKSLMLSPHDYDDRALFDPLTRRLMEKIRFEHGGPEYDAKYPDGIPTSVTLVKPSGQILDSGMVTYPAGHARNTEADLGGILDCKFSMLASHAAHGPKPLEQDIERMRSLGSLTAQELLHVYDFPTAKFA